MTISVSTKVCSFGKQVVEKVEVSGAPAGGWGGWDSRARAAWNPNPVTPPTSLPQTEYARLENGRFVYRIHRSPMCEYMINFIHKLEHLPEKYMMNSVLENFTILQVGAGARGRPGGGRPAVCSPRLPALPPGGHRPGLSGDPAGHRICF